MRSPGSNGISCCTGAPSKAAIRSDACAAPGLENDTVDAAQAQFGGGGEACWPAADHQYGRGLHAVRAVSAHPTIVGQPPGTAHRLCQ